MVYLEIQILSVEAHLEIRSSIVAVAYLAEDEMMAREKLDSLCSKSSGTYDQLFF